MTTSRHLELVVRARSACLAFARRARRLGRGEGGIAAVEFALILPLMLALYFGCVVLAQGLEVGRKVQLLSRTLADITAQTMPQIGQSGPTLADSDLTNIFGASQSVLYPFTGATTMTISEIVFDNIGGTSGVCCEAKVVWSVATGSTGSSPQVRACGVLSQSSNGQNALNQMPAGLYPGKGSGLGGTSGSSTTDTYLIVADVTYQYNPSFSFQPNAWGHPGNGYMITQTTYMSPRNGSASPASSTTSPSYQLPAIQWAKGGAFTSPSPSYCTAEGAGSASGGGYNTP